MSQSRRIFIYLSTIGELEREVIRFFGREECYVYLTESLGSQLPANVMEFRKSGGFKHARNILKEGKDSFTVLINLNALNLFHQDELVPWGEAVRETLHFTSEAIKNIGVFVKEGRVINILPLPPLTDDLRDKYNALKTGYTGLSDIWGAELGKQAVTINTIIPGYFNISSHPGRIMLDRPGRGAELASVVGFMASPQSAYITNAAIPVDGGLLF